MLIELENTTKIYNQGKPNEVTALYDVSLQIEDQTMVCLQGASGSGKSTLLAIIGCVFPPSSGRASIAGKQLSRMPDSCLLYTSDAADEYNPVYISVVAVSLKKFF